MITRDEWGHIALVATAVLAAVAVGARALTGGFITLDDPEDILDNPSIQHLTAHDVAHWFTAPLQFMYTPLTSLSYAVDWQLHGASAPGYHLTNLLLHAVNVVLAYAIVWELVGRRFVAGFVAVALAVHPVDVDSVAWIAARSNLLSTAFFLGALLVYSRHQRAPTARRLAMAVVLFTLACLAKSAAVALPVVLVLWDLARGRRLTRRVLLEKLPFVAVALAAGLVTLHFRSDTVAPYPYSLSDRVLVHTSATAGYLRALVWPHPLAFGYAWPRPVDGALPWGVRLSPLVLVGAGAALWIAFRLLRLPVRLLAVGTAFFAVTLLPTQVVLLMDGYRTNRYAYLPYLGLFLVAALVAERLLAVRTGPVPWRPAVAGLLTVAAAALGVVAYQRAGLFRDARALLDDSVRHEPDVAFVYNSRAVARYRDGDFAGALTDYDRALALEPHLGVWNNIGIARQAMNDLPGALAAYDEAIRTAPGSGDAYYNRGVLRLRQSDLGAACADWRLAASLGYRPADDTRQRNGCPAATPQPPQLPQAGPTTSR